MKKNHVFVDYENAPISSLALLKGEQFFVYLFLGPHNSKLPIELVLAMQELGDRAKYVVLDTHGKNALDFHIAYYLGMIASYDPEGYFHIISKDMGFDPLISHLRSKNIYCARSVSIEEMPCFKRPPTAKPGNSADSPAPEPPLKNSTPKDALEDLIRLALNDLISRKASKPRTLQTLRNTIHAKCGKETSVKNIDAVMETLIARKYVNINGTKVSYTLPAHD